jgi:CBS domain-containing protein
VKKVKEILQEKGGTVYSVGPEASVIDALRLMAERNIGVVVVVEDGHIAGIFSERDLVADLATHDCQSILEPIRIHMTSPVYFVTPEQTLEDCMVVMNAKNIRHIPVLEDDTLAGMISIRDVIDALIGDRDERIETLEHLLWVNLI